MVRSPWLQIAIAYAVLEVALWTEMPAQEYVSLVATGVILGFVFAARTPAAELGLHFPGLPASLWPAVIGALAAWVIVLIALATDSLHVLYGSRPPLQHAALYFVWALVQQFILQSFFYVRVESALGKGWRTVIVTALLFCLAHIPNPVLVPATFAGALFFCACFRKYRTIYPLAIAHAILSLALAISLPDALLHHMRVGIAYVR